MIASAEPGTTLAGDEEIAVLWRNFKLTESLTDRDTLLLHYSPLVKYVAGRFGSGLPQFVETADLISYGIFGLMDAIQKFEPDRGHRFETYAVSRIRGAILDELRTLDWVPRSVRARIRAAEQAYSALQAQHSRTPTEAEVAMELNLTLAELGQLFTQMSFSNVVALDELVRQHGDHSENSAASLGDLLRDARSDPPGAALEAADQARALSRAIAGLPERDRIVISLYYYEELTLAEIGEVLGITESRVCQLHTRARLALKSALLAADSEQGDTTPAAPGHRASATPPRRTSRRSA
ncbi:MAG: FliA/WhiG family RNA polymerase sigma factor [Geodermatophilaceae bacterium]|nr:FliA/WhiG family RNA polymerase sigma factor [Geodermatophilaceae bacterium]